MCWGTSCSPNRMHENYLIEIDSLTYHYPDSAILCLRRLANIIEKQPINFAFVICLFPDRTYRKMKLFCKRYEILQNFIGFEKI